jgi:hypothetical protein
VLYKLSNYALHLGFDSRQLNIHVLFYEQRTRRTAYTLGLLERPRKGRRVDSLLREIENPNLHDIRNMNFRVELWDRNALHIRWVVAASGTVFLARAAFEEAVKQWPDQKLTLRNGIMLMREHPPTKRG